MFAGVHTLRPVGQFWVFQLVVSVNPPGPAAVAVGVVALLCAEGIDDLLLCRVVA